MQKFTKWQLKETGTYFGLLGLSTKIVTGKKVDKLEQVRVVADALRADNKGDAHCKQRTYVTRANVLWIRIMREFPLPPWHYEWKERQRRKYKMTLLLVFNWRAAKIEAADIISFFFFYLYFV